MNTLTAVAGFGYLALAGWAARLAWADERAGLRRSRMLLGLAAGLSAIWAVLWDARAFSIHFDGFSLGLDWLRQVAWMAWLSHALGLWHRQAKAWLGLRSAVPLMLLAAALAMASPQWRLLSREWLAVAPAYAGLGLAVLGLVLLEQLYRNTSEDQRWNLKPICLGLATMYGFDLYLYSEAVLLRGQAEEALALRPMAHALGLPLLALGMLRSTRLVRRLELSRDAVFHSAALLLAGTYLLVVAALGYWLRLTGGQWGLALQLLLLVGSALLLGVLLMSGAMRARLRVWLSKHFLRYRYDYRQEWLRFTAALADRASEGDPARAAVRALANLVESPGGALWHGTADQQLQVAHWNFERPASREPTQSPFVQALASKKWIVDLNAERRSPSGVVPVPEWLLADADAWLVIPLLSDARLVGWVVLAQPRTPFPLNWEVLDLLRSAASQAAGYLAMQQALEQLLEARKFEAFNRMSAFVVHDLKNIVTQLSLMMRNAKRHGDNPEFRQDMLETVDNAVEKMRQLMTQLREGERPAGITSGVPLQAIAHRLQATASQRGRRLELELHEALSTRGHEQRVERVIGHAVQNAFDASQEHQPVVLRLERLGSYAKLQVKDEGCGMSESFVRERLFKPFQSTKEQGMGIGAYESLQYVQELGGKMEVQSDPGQGTCITFLLPLFHSHQVPSQGDHS